MLSPISTTTHFRPTLKALSSLLNFWSLYGDYLAIGKYRIPKNASFLFHSCIMNAYLHQTVLFCVQFNFYATKRTFEADCRQYQFSEQLFFYQANFCSKSPHHGYAHIFRVLRIVVRPIARCLHVLHIVCGGQFAAHRLLFVSACNCRWHSIAPAANRSILRGSLSLRWPPTA